ncbi:2OG-Fe dioxygenase family protein [Streptomyces lancefieldiae]|uniref:2OG-Fe dioxygenase family protein n=1 Tax=Streptomyces lancefieldiae TaxID=3075520 RepID=A0ABU3AFX8_9ACTN|nr:2OG-Fe dioxygenase family protein [Streptomyces sp. DSM 40712]MDT0609084.1 2OG-Fe dioxygenase family protein [Streptomyces sp. DSM 40712]
MDDGNTTSAGRESGTGHAAGAPAHPSLEEACQALVSTGSYVMTPDAVSQCLGVERGGWAWFARHWDELALDTYAAQTGTRRLRRYGHFSLSRAGDIVVRPHVAFVQPQESNPLYVEVDRHFEPLTDAFVAEPVLTSLIRMLGQVAACLDDADEWNVKVHPFRVMAEADGEGQPTPEGRHRDGVTLVTSLLIDRVNAAGGESTVYDLDGAALMSTTLSRPGALLLGDDRATLHGVSPIRPLDASLPAYRDVLVTTLTPR